MISFGMTNEQELVRDSMREFAAGAMRPIARECDETSSIPADFLQAAWDLGLTSTQIPEAYGGAGEARSPVTNAILLEELAHGDVTLAAAALAPSLFANAIVDHGSDDQKRRELPRFCGDRFQVGSLAIAEPGPVSEPMRPRTLAEPKADGFLLSGLKSCVVFGDRASSFLVTARCGERLDAFVVPQGAAGLSISRPEKNLGLRGLTTVCLELERVPVKAVDRLGGEAGCDVRALVNNARAGICAALVGLSRAVLEYCVPYAKERVAFDEAIAKKQAIAFRLADMHIEIEAMRLLVWKAASQLEQGLDATRAAHLARSYVAEKSLWIADNGIQVLGGHGFIREHPVEMWFRNARTLSVLEGALAL